jgi:hypothetical protein
MNGVNLGNVSQITIAVVLVLIFLFGIDVL